MTAKRVYHMKEELWLYPGATASWHFITIPKGVSGEIKKAVAGSKRGWGSVRVSATIGRTTWKTSIFPDSKAGAYLLPVKAEVRKKEGIQKGERVGLSLQVEG